MKYSKVIIGGFAATTVMTLFMLSTQLIHLPVVDAGAMLGTLFGDNPAFGWLLHFSIGLFFAFAYALYFNEWLPVISDTARGALFGIIVFVFSEAVFAIINLAGYFDWQMKEAMAKSIFVNMLACFIYGSVLGSIVKEYKIENGLHWEKKAYFWRFLKKEKHSTHH